MNSAPLAITIGLVLVGASVAGIAYASFATDAAVPFGDEGHDHASHEHPANGAGADLARLEEGEAGDGHDHGQLGMDRPAFPPAVGSVPTESDAEALEQVSRLVIHSDDDFVPANGVRSGNGTLDDPYIITGYYVTGDLYIADTDACFIVKENWIGGQLSLNWNGQCTHVHHNHVRDLRVNENIARTGYATGGLLELNEIEFIGQLRHYDGEFRHNVVGPFTQQSIFDPILETVPWMFATDPRVANIDGFNQGLIHHNTFFGSVDLDYHGHHHGTGFFASHSHYHGDMEEKKMAHDHTMRWTSVAFTDNKIVDYEGYGLRYEDRNHAGDDRTANSEQEDTLNDPHIHHTHIVISRNTIEGGQVWIDVFNADDQLHYDRNPGWLDVEDNIVEYMPREADTLLGLPFFGAGTDWGAAMHIETAKEVELRVIGNIVTLLEPAPSDSGPLDIDLWPFDDGDEGVFTGIQIHSMRDANVTIEDNVLDGFYYGVAAYDMAEDTYWTVEGNDFGDAQYEVYYDDSVENEPGGSDG